jgi:hypothetical protein
VKESKMKRKLFLSLILILGITLLFAGTPRSYVQRCSLADGSEAPVTNTGATTSPDYILRATMIGPATGPETLGTDLGTPVTSLYIARLGTGTTIPYYTGTVLQLGTFPTQWQAGWTIHMYVKYIPTQEVAEWDIVIPPGGATINIQEPVQVIPPYPVIPQVLTITSDPTGQPIWINGVDSECTTPHDFENPTVGDVYTIGNPAYTWEPSSYTVPEEFTTTTINFIGTPVIVDTWTLTVKTYKDGIEQTDVTVLRDGAEIGITFVPIVKNSLDEIIGVYSLSGGVVGGQFWDPATITVTEADFALLPGGKGIKSAGFGKKNDAKADYAAEITFQMKTAYSLTINGPADAATVGATAVTGPAGTVVGNIPLFTIVDNDDNENDLIGPYTIAALPTTVDAFAGGIRKHWVVNPINVTEDLFDADVASITFQWRDYLARWDIPAVPELPDAHLFFVPIAAPEVIDYGPLPVTLYYHGTKETWGEWKDPEEGSYYVEPEPEDFNPSAPEVPPLNNPGPLGGDKQSYTLTIQAYDSVTSAYVNVPITINGVPPSGATTPYTCVDPVGGTVFSIHDPDNDYTWAPLDYTVPAGGLTEDTEIIFTLSPYSPPLPVELSSFTAVLTNDLYVQLTWVSQSETNLGGYRVYRNEESTLNNAILITPTMIQATNTSQEHSYTIEDREVENHSTYYYWLESVDFNNSQFYGPVSVIVDGNVPPVLPEVTTLKSAYPNPFRANNSTNIEVSIKAGETGTLTIYNIMGQVVKTYSVAEGNHIIPWNGKDSQGNNCGSGIYFYKLTTPSLNQTKKMVIVK